MKENKERSGEKNMQVVFNRRIPFTTYEFGVILICLASIALSIVLLHTLISS